MKKGLRASALFAVIGIGIILTCAAPAPHALAAIFEPGFETEVVAGGLSLPTNMAFAPDGRIFVAEKNGTVRLIKNGVLQPAPVVVLSDINTFGDRGLLSVELDPDFLTNGYLYLAYTYENTPGLNFTGPKTGRIVRLTVAGDTASETTKVVLVGTIGGDSTAPSCKNFATTSDCIPSDSPSHSVGALRFGQDGKLYATLGDGAHFDFTDVDSKRAQDVDSLGGKLLRINKDGTAPADNPFYNGDPNANRSKVFALGFRNAFRINFGPGGALFAGDVGWGSWEEVNKILPGNNYGWPCWEGNATTLHNCSASTTNTAPLYTYAHDANGAGSVAVGSFSKNSAYPATYNTSFFFGDYAQNWIKRLELDVNNNFVAIHDFMDNPDGPVDLATGPDGNVYYLSIYTGELHRITHTTGNRRPVPMLSATPTSGAAPLTVAFSSAGSNDPDGDALSYLWNFGDGTSSTSPNPTKVYTAVDTYTASLTLTDSNGSSVSKSVTITVGNQAPSADITNPASGSLYFAFQTVKVDGTATDPETGVLPASAYHWDVVLHHNTHIHVFQQFDATTSPSFVAPDHNDTDVYLEIKLTVTDPAGLTATKSINMYINNGVTTGNIIANPSMELAEAGVARPQQWQNSLYGTMNVAFTYPVAGIEGASAARVQVNSYTSGGAKWYFEPVAVVPGATYNFSSWYTANVPTALYAQYEMPGGVMQYAELGAVPPAGSATQITRALTIPPNVQRLSVFHDLERVGILTTDNFSLMLAGSDTTSPTVSILSPTSLSTLEGTTTVLVSAADNTAVVGVTFFVDGVQVESEDASAPYEFVWNTRTFNNGAHTLTARARDAAGNTTTSSGVDVSLNNNLILNGSFETANGINPLGWSRDTWGTHTAGYTYPVTGFDGNKAVEFTITNYEVTDTGDSAWKFVDVPVTPGVEYTYTERYKGTTISDVIGRYTFADGTQHFFGLTKELPASATWRFNSGKFVPPLNTVSVTLRHQISTEATVALDDVWMFVSGTGTPSEIVPPVVTWVNPVASSTVSGQITLEANATDNVGVAGLFFAVDGTPITGEFATGPYTTLWNTTGYTNGPHVLKATARDAVGNNSAKSITVVVNNTAGTTTGIANGSVEVDGTGGNPQSWLRGGWGNNVATYTYPVTGIVGAKAVRVAVSSITDGDAKWYFADVSAAGGSTHTVTHRYRSDVPSEIVARFAMPGGTYQYQFLSTKPASATWSTSTSTIVLPATATAFTLFHLINAVGFLETDDFVLLGTTPPPPPPPGSVFNFALSNAGGRTVVQGQSTTTSVTATLATGTAQSVSFSVSSVLPSGVTASFSQISCSPTCTTTLTLTASASAAVGTHPVTVSGTAGTTTKITTLDLVVVAASTSPPSGSNIFLNASVETPNGASPVSWISGKWGTTVAAFTYPTGSAQDGSRHVTTQITTAGTGDAKWKPNHVPAVPGQTYTFSNYYKSSVQSFVEVEYLLTNDTYQYVRLATLPAAASWSKYEKSFVAPANTKSMTLLHFIRAAGTLSVDNYLLTDGSTPPPPNPAFDYALTNAGNRTVIQGQATTTSITATLTSGAGAVVSFGASGLPSGVIAAFSQTSCTPTCTTTLTLTASASAATGTVPVSISATAGTTTKTTSFNLTVNAAAVVPPTGNNLIVNGSVETANGAVPASWVSDKWGTTAATFTYPTGGAQEGNRYVRTQITTAGTGDAKWAPTHIPATPAKTYVFSDYYQSTATSYVEVEYLLTNGTYQYVLLATLPAQAGWAQYQTTFTTPANVQSMTVFHYIKAVGTLSVDNYTLTLQP